MELLTGLAVAIASIEAVRSPDNSDGDGDHLPRGHVFTAWLRGIFKQFLPSPQRARLALANAFKARLPLPQQRFRLVLCWLGNDSAGTRHGHGRGSLHEH